MFKSYNRLYLRESRDIQEQLVYNKSLFPIELKGLEYSVIADLARSNFLLSSLLLHT